MKKGTKVKIIKTKDDPASTSIDLYGLIGFYMEKLDDIHVRISVHKDDNPTHSLFLNNLYTVRVPVKNLILWDMEDQLDHLDKLIHKYETTNRG